MSTFERVKQERQTRVESKTSVIYEVLWWDSRTYKDRTYTYVNRRPYGTVNDAKKHFDTLDPASEPEISKLTFDPLRRIWDRESVTDYARYDRRQQAEVNRVGAKAVRDAQGDAPITRRMDDEPF